MLVRSCILIFLFVSSICHAEQVSDSKDCDRIAMFAAAAVDAKNNGLDFMTFSKKIDEIEAPDDAKGAIKYIVSKAYSSSSTPEEAYSSTYMDCMVSKAN